MRVAHVHSGRVFANWPTSKTPLAYVQTAAFSPSRRRPPARSPTTRPHLHRLSRLLRLHSGLLGIGNDKGKVLLYRLNHYPAA